MAKWSIDPDHSVACFSVRHMMISNVHGQFNKMSGTIRFDPPDLAGLSVEGEVDVEGIYTGIWKRDEHLRSPDFFDVEKYPKIVFKSTGVEGIGGNRSRVKGDLTIRGITRQVAFEVEYSGPVKDPSDEGGMSIGFSASTAINPEDYGMTWNVAMEGGGVVVGKEIRITLDVEADLTTD